MKQGESQNKSIERQGLEMEYFEDEHYVELSNGMGFYCESYEKALELEDEFGDMDISDFEA